MLESPTSALIFALDWHRNLTGETNVTDMSLSSLLLYVIKIRVWEARAVLKNTPFRLFLDKPQSLKQREALLFKFVKAAQELPEYKIATFQLGKVWKDGVGFEFEEFDFLPVLLRPACFLASQ